MKTREDYIFDEVSAELEERGSIYDLLDEAYSDLDQHDRRKLCDTRLSDFAEELFASEEPLNLMSEFKDEVIWLVVESRLKREKVL